MLSTTAGALEITQDAATFPQLLSTGPVDAPDNFSTVEVKVSGTVNNLFQKFDSTLGTLTAVDFIYDVSVDNGGSCTGGSSLAACSMFFFSGLTGSNGLTAVNPFAPDIVADQESLLTRDLNQDLSYSGITSLPNVADFIGIGSIGDIAAEALIQKANSTADLEDVTIAFNGEYKLRYTYDPVVTPPPPNGTTPSPATLALLGLGVVGLCLRRKRCVIRQTN